MKIKTSFVYFSKASVRLAFLYGVIVLSKLCVTFWLATTYGESFLHPDSNTYILTAQNILHGNGFANETAPEVFRTPGYPIFLALGFIIDEPFIYTVALMQLLLVFVCALLTFATTELISNNKIAAHLSAVMVLISPEMFIYQHAILTEILFTTLLCLSAYLIVNSIKYSSAISMIFGIVFITISAFVRPIAVYFPYVLVLILIIYFIVQRKAINVKTKMLVAVVIALALHIQFIDAWRARNQKLLGTNEFSSVQSVNLNEYISAAIVSRASGEDWRSLREKYRTEYKLLPISERHRFATTRFLETIREYPTESAIIFIRGFVVNASDPGFGDWLNFLKLRVRNSGIIYKFNNMEIVDFIYFLCVNERALLILSICGMLYIVLLWMLFFKGLNQFKSSIFALVVVTYILYVMALSAGPQSLARFRVPVIPFIIIFCSIGISSIFNSRPSYFKDGTLKKN